MRVPDGVVSTNWMSPAHVWDMLLSLISVTQVAPAGIVLTLRVDVNANGGKVPGYVPPPPVPDVGTTPPEPPVVQGAMVCADASLAPNARNETPRTPRKRERIEGDSCS